jgi:3-isopropylmalate/(R)-2-methylmalate dehydratase large subunit
MTRVPSTLFAKLWEPHVVTSRPDGRTLLFIDRHLLHDGSFHAFARLREKGIAVAHPELCLATPDHYVPTSDGRSLGSVADSSVLRVLHHFNTNMRRNRIPAFPMGDARQGIVHVVGPELGFTLPGTTIVCGDSHTSTHGALGALAFGIGASEVAHVLATQCLWQLPPRTMLVVIDGRLAAGVYAKDLALALIASVGAGGAIGHVIEYAGSLVRALSIEQRCTLCNMAIEAGARAGFVAPDETTLSYLHGRPMAPIGDAWDAGVEYWSTLRSDEGARFDREYALDAGTVPPMVTWGTSPEQAVAIDGSVPDPADRYDESERRMVASALAYMGLEAGQPIALVDVDQVFIGSCTNSRIEDLRIVADLVRRIGGRARVPTLVSPGSGSVKQQAEREGLADVFVGAGFEWREPGCSMCIGMNGDIVGPSKRCVSTSNRNFAGRQGRDARTHLVSPATAAATAMLGHLADVRTML